MGVKTVRRVLEKSRATGADRLVEIVLAEHANDVTGTCWPGTSLIAVEALALDPALLDDKSADAKRAVATAKRRVKRSLSSLKKLGEIEISYRSGPPGSTLPSQYRTNIYRFRGDTDTTSEMTPRPPLEVTVVVARGDCGGNSEVTPQPPKPSLEPKAEPAANEIVEQATAELARRRLAVRKQSGKEIKTEPGLLRHIANEDFLPIVLEYRRANPSWSAEAIVADIERSGRHHQRPKTTAPTQPPASKPIDTRYHLENSLHGARLSGDEDAIASLEAELAQLEAAS